MEGKVTIEMLVQAMYYGNVVIGMMAILAFFILMGVKEMKKW